MKGLSSLFVSRNTIIILLVIVTGTALLYADFAMTRRPPTLPATPVVSKAVVLNGVDRWDGDRKTTTPAFDFSLPGTQPLSVSPLFDQYYHRYGGATSLGAPVTVDFPTDQGWIQFFGLGALLLPAAQREHTYATEDSLAALIETGVRDPTTGIIRLPLLQALLTLGSQVPIGSDGSPLTYVDLRKATNPDLMLSAPAAGRTVAPSPAGSQGVFIKEGTRAGKDVGHLIPEPIWSYINRSDISPDGWQTDFGAPLTEALSFATTKNGSVHQMLVQAFWRDGWYSTKTPWMPRPSSRSNDLMPVWPTCAPLVHPLLR